MTKSAPIAIAGILFAGCLDDHPRLNEIQVLGTHNSYHVQPRPSLLAALAGFDAELAASLEYTHLPIAEQLERGARQLEIDVFADPEGGRYARRAGLCAVGEDPNAGFAELDAPGLKVLHVQDIDFETHCLSFVACLTTIRAWSQAHPEHVPLMVMIEAKQDPIDDPLGLGFVVPLPFGAVEVDAIDAEIRSVFSEDQLITPDQVRGGADTLAEVVTSRGWPSVAEARGHVMFTLLNGDATRERYVDGHPSLAGRVMFTNSPVESAEAAFFNVNDARVAGERIAELVARGFLVRTRADIDTREARRGDSALLAAALASGAQYVSTDYLVPDPALGTGYVATLPDGGTVRCNPLADPHRCDPTQLEASPVDPLQ